MQAAWYFLVVPESKAARDGRKMSTDATSTIWFTVNCEPYFHENPNARLSIVVDACIH
jgi:hypothetical protein